jgi:hypothetical protein
MGQDTVRGIGGGCGALETASSAVPRLMARRRPGGGGGARWWYAGVNGECALAEAMWPGHAEPPLWLCVLAVVGLGEMGDSTTDHANRAEVGVCTVCGVYGWVGAAATDVGDWAWWQTGSCDSSCKCN